jgi:hypothetical protein
MVSPGGKPWTGTVVGIANLFFFRIPGLRTRGIVTVGNASELGRLSGNARSCPRIQPIRITSGIAGKAGGNVTPSTGRNTVKDIPGFANEIVYCNEFETRNDRWPGEATRT